MRYSWGMPSLQDAAMNPIPASSLAALPLPLPAPAVSEPDGPVRVHGLRISTGRFRTAGGVEERWIVQTPDNARREAAGEREIGGDSLMPTFDEAVREASLLAERDRKDAEWKRQCEAQSAATAAVKTAAALDSINGFTDGMPANRAALAHKALDKPIRVDGKAASIRAHIEAWRDGEGLRLTTFEEPKIKPMSRMRHFRATESEQRQHEERMRRAGTKTTYLVNGYELGKTAYDYAQHLSDLDSPAATAA